MDGGNHIQLLTRGSNHLIGNALNKVLELSRNKGLDAHFVLLRIIITILASHFGRRLEGGFKHTTGVIRSAVSRETRQARDCRSCLLVGIDGHTLGDGGGGCLVTTPSTRAAIIGQ